LSDLPDEVKKYFVELAAKRKARGIVLRKWSIMMDSAALESVDTLWESWVRALGKRAAEDNLLEAMVNQHDLIRARLQYKVNNRDRESEGRGGNKGGA
jgi:hypothetical protein